MVISENYCVFIVLNYKVLRTIIAMLTEDKVTELFFMADEFCKFFDWMMARYTLRNTGKRPYHRESTLSKAEIMLIFFGIHTANVVNLARRESVQVALAS